MPSTPAIRIRWGRVALHLVLGLGWIALILARNPKAELAQIALMLLAAGWLPTIPVAIAESRLTSVTRLLLMDCLVAGLLVLVVLFVYVNLFFTAVIWFLPLLLLPRGVITELLMRPWDNKFSR